MKEWFGSPGKVSGLVMRIGQCLFAAASIAVMASASGFSSTTAFCYLIASMGLQFLWSFGLACLDYQALRLRKSLQSHILVSLFAVGDWVTAILAFAATCASAGVTVLLVKDTDICRKSIQLACNMFQISVALAFISWLLLARSCYIMFWLLASF